MFVTLAPVLFFVASQQNRHSYGKGNLGKTQDAICYQLDGKMLNTSPEQVLNPHGKEKRITGKANEAIQSVTC